MLHYGSWMRSSYSSSSSNNTQEHQKLAKQSTAARQRVWRSPSQSAIVIFSFRPKVPLLAVVIFPIKICWIPYPAYNTASIQLVAFMGWSTHTPTDDRNRYGPVHFESLSFFSREKHFWYAVDAAYYGENGNLKRVISTLSPKHDIMEFSLIEMDINFFPLFPWAHMAEGGSGAFFVLHFYYKKLLLLWRQMRWQREKKVEQKPKPFD